jgi:hypothetical protein
MHPVTAEALDALRTSNKPPRLFKMGGALVRIRRDENGPRIEPLTEDSMRGVLDRSAIWGRSCGADKPGQGTKQGESRLCITPAPKHIVRDILALADWSDEVFPPLVGIVRCPVLAPDGSLIDKPGYHAASGLWYEPDPNLVVPPFPEQPGDDCVTEAKCLIDELLINFPFKTEADKANATAFLITPLVRNMIKGPTPFGLIEAPSAGTGKGLLAKCLAIPAVGMPGLSTQPENDAEWRKALTAKLVGSPQVVIFDNLAKKLESPALEEVLTSEFWSDRELGATRTLVLPVLCTWLGTANNLQILGDLHRRLVWIRLDARMEYPDQRHPSEFTHPLPEWALQNRGRLLWAALILIRAWVVKGRKPGDKVMGSYEDWARTLDGILDNAGIKGFLSGQKERRVNADDDSSIWQGFCESIHRKRGAEKFGVADLNWVVDPEDKHYEEDVVAGLLTAKTPNGRRKQLGKFLQKVRDRVFGSFQLVDCGKDTHDKCHKYRVDKLAHRPANRPVPSWSPRNRRRSREEPADPVTQARIDRFWEHIHLCNILHDFDVDRFDQYLDLCEALWVNCGGLRLVTDRTLVRFAESQRLLRALLPSDTEDGRIIDLRDQLWVVNCVMKGLMEIGHMDRFRHQGRWMSRYAIDDQSYPIVVGPSTAEEAEYYGPSYYGTFADLCSCWWAFEDHSLVTSRLLGLIHQFNLLPGFADVYDRAEQIRELAHVLTAVQDIEFEGFVIRDTWPPAVVKHEDRVFRIELLNGFALPQKPASRYCAEAYRLYGKPYVISDKDFPWLCGARPGQGKTP